MNSPLRARPFAMSTSRFGARVDVAVDRVAEARDGAFAGAVVLHQFDGHVGALGGRGRDDLLQKLRTPRWQCPRSDPLLEQPRNDRALYGLWRAVMREARDDRGRHEPVLHDRDQHGIENGHLGRRGRLAGELQEHQLREAHLPHQVGNEVFAADRDVFRVVSAMEVLAMRKLLRF